jgi:putative hydrolase of the HAD superfamily
MSTLARADSLRGIAFDLDHTLSPRDAAFWRWIDDECQVCPAHTLDRDRVAKLDEGGHGPKEPLLAYLAEALRWPESDFKRRHHRFVHGTLRATLPDPRVQALLQRLSKSYRLAIITNGTSVAQRGKLERLGLLHSVETVLVSEEVGIKKPDRAIFLRLALEWGLATDELAFVGDHPEKDVLAARAAGMLPIWVAAGKSWPLAPPAPLQIDHVLELESLLHRLAS